MAMHYQWETLSDGVWRCRLPFCDVGVGLVRGGAGTALVGSHTEVADRIAEYAEIGIDEFIFSGYPHMEECKIFGEKVMPHLTTCSLPQEYGRVPSETPMTPLGAGERK